MSLEKTTTNQSTRSRRSCGRNDTVPESTDQTKEAVDNSQNNSDEETYADPSDPLAGHLHHLTRDQTEALQSFKEACIEKGLYTPAEEGKDASHGDATLLYGSFCSSVGFVPCFVLRCGGKLRGEEDCYC